MKKITFLVAFALISVFAFAQQKSTKTTSESGFKAVKVLNSSNYQTSESKAVLDSLHYDGDNDNAIGTNGAANFGVYAFFSEATMAPQATLDHYILSVKVFINGVQNVASTQLRFYTDTLSTAMVYSQDFIPVEGWNNVILTTPHAIPSTGNLFVGYNLIVTGGYPAGCDEGPVNLNGNWIHMGSWGHLSDLSAELTGNWNIRAMCGTLPTTPVAYCTPLSWNAGTLVAPNTTTSGTFTLTNSGVGTLTSTGISGLSAPFTTTFDPTSINLAGGASATFTFTYTPTAVGTDNQTVVIATSGGDITINLSGAAITCPEISAFPWTEGFEGAAFPPACWTILDVDGDNNKWFQGTTPGVAAHAGEKCAVSASWVAPSTILTPDNWLITPKFDINASNLELRFWVAAQDPAYPAEKYSVLVSTTGTAPADFTAIHTQTLSSAVYSEIVLPLTSYNNQSIHIAFRHFDSSDNFQMKIDAVSIATASSVGINTASSSYKIYPNPAKNSIRVESNQIINKVRIVNVLGQEVYSEILSNHGAQINVSNLQSGIYFVNIETTEGTKTQKINILK
jgi:hypothetical protein